MIDLKFFSVLLYLPVEMYLDTCDSDVSSQKLHLFWVKLLNFHNSKLILVNVLF